MKLPEKKTTHRSDGGFRTPGGVILSPFNNRSIPAFVFCRDTSSPSSDRLKDAAEALPAPWGSVSCRHVLRSYFMCFFPPPLPVFLMLGTQHLHWIGFSSSPFVMRFSLFFLSYFSRRACFFFLFFFSRLSFCSVRVVFNSASVLAASVSAQLSSPYISPSLSL